MEEEKTVSVRWSQLFDQFKEDTPKEVARQKISELEKLVVRPKVTHRLHEPGNLFRYPDHLNRDFGATTTTSSTATQPSEALEARLRGLEATILHADAVITALKIRIDELEARVKDQEERLMKTNTNYGRF